MAELGIVAAVGRKGRGTTACHATDASDQRVPELARACLAVLGAQLRADPEGADPRVRPQDHGLAPVQCTSRWLDAFPGIGPALATALVASVADLKAFRSGRNFSAWIGLVPKEHSERR
jgi:transposase